MSKKDSDSFYYNVRNKYNHSQPSASQAARFLYLNRTCFNGIFRVNKADEFNVPYAYKTKPFFPDQDAILAFAKALKSATLTKENYQSALGKIRKDDFVYLDPPYPSLNGTSNFSHYTMDRFNNHDQLDLAKQVKRIDKLNAKFMLSNADTKLIRQLYDGFNFYPLQVTRFVTCKAIRHRVRELIITNY